MMDFYFEYVRNKAKKVRKFYFSMPKMFSCFVFEGSMRAYKFNIMERKKRKNYDFTPF
jgi:hypothetical protein